MSDALENSEPSQTPAPIDDGTTAKDEAETAKLFAEAKKLAAEARYLARPFWQRTETLGFIGSLLVAAVGLGGVIWTQSIKDQLQKVQDQRNQLQESRREFEASKKALQPHIDELETKEGALEANVADLSEESSQQLEKNSELRAAADTLRLQLKQLQDNVPYAQIDVLMDQMERDYATSDASRVDESIRRLFREATADQRPLLIVRCEQRANRAGVDPRIRLIIYDMLYSVTDDSQFKTVWIKFAERYFFASQSDLPKSKIGKYQNIIWGTILRNSFDHSLLDPSDSRLLANALWEDKLYLGKELKNASPDELGQYLFVNQRGGLQNSEAYFKTLAEVQGRLLTATDPEIVRRLAEILSRHEPQCFVLTWYFGSDANNWKSSTGEFVERADQTLRSFSKENYLHPLKFMPVLNDPKTHWSVEDWMAANTKLVNFWVPINYDERVYDPLAQVLLRRDAIGQSDLPDSEVQRLEKSSES